MRRHRDRQRGAALIELAVLVVPAFLMLLAYAVFFGRVLYNYQVAQKAAQDAARYLAGAPAINMGDPALVASEVAVAKAIADAGLRELRPGPYRGPYVTVQCGNKDCLGFGLPATVTVRVALINHNDLFTDFAVELVDGQMDIGSTMRYVGN
jgi:hypothetical protein